MYVKILESNFIVENIAAFLQLSLSKWTIAKRHLVLTVITI